MTLNGILYENKIIQFSVLCIICDSPAKAFLLSVKGHGGYSSCTKYRVEGIYHENRTCFPDTTAPKRTDREFIMKTDEDYHMENSSCLLEEISNLGLVTNVPLDYMHLVCLGVKRKMLLLWIKGKLNGTRMPYRQIKQISDNLISLREDVPLEFSRKPRNLEDIKHWKATEFRQILYTGPMVLKNILRHDKYTHFLSFHVAVRMLCADQCTNIDYAQALLVHFVKWFADLYGPEHVSHNVHGLIHLADDVRIF